VADISVAGITFLSTMIVKISANGRTSPHVQPEKSNTFSGPGIFCHEIKIP
jgi:hypothetical protein